MTEYECVECNICCYKSYERIKDLGLDPDSDDDLDRMILCPCWGEYAIFHKVEEEEYEEDGE